jgi:hypothetical protein
MGTGGDNRGWDSNRAQAPALEDLVYFLQLPGREPAAQNDLKTAKTKSSKSIYETYNTPQPFLSRCSIELWSNNSTGI